MHHSVLLTFTALFVVMGSGCSLMAPQYSASMDNVQKLKDAGAYQVKVGRFDSSNDPANANPISLRGSTVSSPYENSYATYLEEAIRQELALADKLTPDTDVEVSGLLLKNDMDAGA